MDPWMMLRDHVKREAGRVALRVGKFGRLVRRYEATPDGAAWNLELTPCGHIVRRDRHGDRYTLRVAMCERCEGGSR
jgi:hypothetical protein